MKSRYNFRRMRERFFGFSQYFLKESIELPQDAGAFFLLLSQCFNDFHYFLQHHLFFSFLFSFFLSFSYLFFCRRKSTALFFWPSTLICSQKSWIRKPNHVNSVANTKNVIAKHEWLFINAIDLHSFQSRIMEKRTSLYRHERVRKRIRI